MLRIDISFPDGVFEHYFSAETMRCCHCVMLEKGKAPRRFTSIPGKAPTADEVRASAVKHDGKISFDNLPK